MRILVVCGAGASSTFVARRIRKAADRRGLAVSAEPCPLDLLAGRIGSADVVLLGPHLGDRRAGLARDAGALGTAVTVMPATVFSSPLGDEALDLALEAAGAGRDRGNRNAATEDPPMVERTVRIGSSHGLHARPAKLFTQAANASGASVTIAKGSGKPVNAASILGVISLGVNHGDYVTLTADGDKAEAVLDDLVELLVTDHDE